MDINRFTEKSREALSTAQGLAAQYGHQEVDAEHLALALVNQEDGFVPRVLERVGVAPKALVTALEAVLKKRPSVRGPGAEMGTITISQRVAKAIANAEALAKRLRDDLLNQCIIGTSPFGFCQDGFALLGIIELCQHNGQAGIGRRIGDSAGVAVLCDT